MEVRIGPKSYRSALPVGFASGTIVDKMDAAAKGQMGQQIFNFDLRVGPQRKLPDGSTESYYQRAFFLNGHCRFRRYNLIDLIIYKIMHIGRRDS